jgi:hypothetical protein
MNWSSLRYLRLQALVFLRGRTSEYLIAPTNAWPDLLVLGLGVAVGIEVGLVLRQNTP